MTAIATTELISELEIVVKAGSAERRNQILRRAASPSLSDADRLREHQAGAFDEVLVRLVGCVDAWTLTDLGASIAGSRSAPSPPDFSVAGAR